MPQNETSVFLLLCPASTFKFGFFPFKQSSFMTVNAVNSCSDVFNVDG